MITVNFPVLHMPTGERGTAIATTFVPGHGWEFLVSLGTIGANGLQVVGTLRVWPAVKCQIEVPL